MDKSRKDGGIGKNDSPQDRSPIFDRGALLLATLLFGVQIIAGSSWWQKLAVKHHFPNQYVTQAIVVFTTVLLYYLAIKLLTRSRLRKGGNQEPKA